MTRHVSTAQIIEYIKTIDYISVDGIIYKNWNITEDSLVVGEKFTFPFSYFDIGGMDSNSLVLADTSHEWRRVQFHDKDNTTLDHPEWDHEAYDITRLKNTDVAAIANQAKFNK